jgi:hypothetical protein
MILRCNQGCKLSDGTTDGSLNIETNEVVCNTCGNNIQGISEFAKISMKNIGDIKRVNKKKAFVFPCKTCDKNVETEITAGKVIGKGCKDGKCLINITEFMIKMIQENQASDFEGNKIDAEQK